jgi:hypothetical protein
MVLLAIVWCLTVGTKTQHHNRKSRPAISKYSTRFRHQSITNGGRQQLAQRGSHTLLPEVSHKYLSDDSAPPLQIHTTQQDHKEENESAIQSQAFPHGHHIQSEQG